MNGLLIFWSILAVASVAALALLRHLYWVALAVALLGAVALAWVGLGPIYQFACVLLGLAMSLTLRERTTPPAYVQHHEFVVSKLEESGYSGFASRYDALDSDDDEVEIESWLDDWETDAYFKGKLWSVVLAKGNRAYKGRYRVLGVKGGRLVVAELKE